MKLNKTTQKIDNNVCKALKLACEDFTNEVDGFCWLTHRANYTNFPASLVVTCIFDIDAEVIAAKEQKVDDHLRDVIQKQLLKVGIVLKNVRHNVHLDSEESCLRDHSGQWSERLKLRVTKQKPTQSKQFGR
tara:strand:- start:1128 stop:1523 length:396 start_codon:yes stop_codon:yes gene_type:complete